jgi:hypothetical protein
VFFLVAMAGRGRGGQSGARGWGRGAAVVGEGARQGAGRALFAEATFEDRRGGEIAVEGLERGRLVPRLEGTTLRGRGRGQGRQQS